MVCPNKMDNLALPHLMSVLRAIAKLQIGLPQTLRDMMMHYFKRSEAD
jgi:hypothetical protein